MYIWEIFISYNRLAKNCNWSPSYYLEPTDTRKPIKCVISIVPKNEIQETQRNLQGAMPTRRTLCQRNWAKSQVDDFAGFPLKTLKWEFILERLIFIPKVILCALASDLNGELRAQLRGLWIPGTWQCAWVPQGSIIAGWSVAFPPLLKESNLGKGEAEEQVHLYCRHVCQLTLWQWLDPGSSSLYILLGVRHWGVQ